jgi:hypothetical protein
MAPLAPVSVESSWLRPEARRLTRRVLAKFPSAGTTARQRSAAILEAQPAGHHSLLRRVDFPHSFFLIGTFAALRGIELLKYDRLDGDDRAPARLI